MTHKNKIAIDIGPTQSGHAIRGVGFYTKNLVRALGNRVEQIHADVSDLEKYDLVHITHFNPFANSFPANIEKTKYVVTIHDLIPLLYPDHYPPGFRGKLKFLSQKKKAQRAQAIITDSETSKKDIVRLLGIAPDKVHVVYLAPQSGLKKLLPNRLQKIKKKYNLPEKFVVYIGDVNYNKNIPNLVRACKQANLPLVIVGKQASEVDYLGNDLTYIKGPMDWLRYLFGIPHPELAHYKSIFEAVKNNPNVKRLGFVPVADLAGVLQLATVYCQPSLYEGFGLPLLEAFSMQVPVVAARTQALVEIGADAAFYVDPLDSADIANGLKKVCEQKSLRVDLVSKATKRLRDFSWEKAANQTLDIYNKILA